MTSGKFSPLSVFLDLRVRQTVVIGGNLIFEIRLLPFQFLFSKQFVQNRRLRACISAASFMIEVGQILRRQRERASELAGYFSLLHMTLYHIIRMIHSMRQR